MDYRPDLRPGTLVRRYKRFLADVVTAEGESVTMHCPNTGAMTGCAEPNSPVWYSTSDNPKRKYAHSLELIETPEGEYIGINSAFANTLVAEALAAEAPVELDGYTEIRREVAVPDEDGRFDFELLSAERPRCFVEVKSVTWHRGAGQGAFPDAQSKRAVRHAHALSRRALAGDRAVLLFCVQHTGIRRVSCASDVDPDYANAVQAALAVGVEVMAYGAAIAPGRSSLALRLPFSLPEIG